jgi:SAM-dependent methyltransferase
MQRIPEPELMTGLEQARAYAAADFSASDQAVLDRLQQLFPEGLGPQLVDLGCGPGNISFRLARAYPAAEVLAVDGAPAMLDLARAQLQQLGRQWPEPMGRLRFLEAVLPDPALPGGASGVVSNSLLHHLHDPGVLWRSLRQLAAPGAAVYIKDLRRPASLEEAEALRARHLDAAPPVLQHDYLASLQAAFTPEEVAGQLSAADLGCLQVAPREDRYLEVWGRLA